MKVGIALDGLLCDTESLKAEWKHRLGVDSYLEDAAFWVALKPYGDIREALSNLDPDIELYVLTGRSKSLFLPTRAWIRNNTGVVLNKKTLIMQSVKRFDCRINGITHFVDSSPEAIENLRHETVFPITPYLIDRGAGDGLSKAIERINSLERT